MKAFSRRFVFIILATIVVVLALGALITSAFGSVNVDDVHQNSKNYQSQTCNSCHDKYSTVSGAAGGWWDAHRRHFVSIFLNFADNDGGVDAYGCAKCHQETTPPTYLEGDASVVKSDAQNDAGKTVRPGVCQECHGKFRKTKHRFGGVEYDYVQLRSDCHTCHNPDGPGLDPEIAHGSAPLESSSSIDPFTAGVWWINQRYANLKDFCIRCHGGLDWFEVEETNPGISCSYDLCHKTSESSFLNTAVADFLYDTTVTGSHSTHFNSVKGPGPCSTCHATHDSCDGCHGDNATTGDHVGHRDDVVNLVDTTSGPVYTNNATLTNTPACDRCHSPEGAYNGVDSSTDSVGAKNNWSSGVYDTTETLSAGKEKWCVGCHDDEPAVVLGQTAQSVGGDRANYGFFKSGHGLDAGSQYDDDAIDDSAGNPGGAIGCDDCHDLKKDHLNGVDDTSFDGQRLSSTVNGTSTPSVVRVCEGCHQNSLGSLSATRQVSTHGNDTAGGYTGVLEEPFSIDCDVCHDPHGNNYAGGSRNLKMVKTVFNGSNTVAFRSSTGTDSYDENSGDPSDLDDICVTCHITPSDDTSLHAGGDNHSVLGDQRGNDCMGCHKHNSFGDATVTPSDGFTPSAACNLCHTFPPGGTQSTYKGSQTHDRHTTTYGLGCSACHNDFPNGHNESGVSSALDWKDKYQPENVDVVFSLSLNPLGESTVTTAADALNFLGRTYDSNRQCLNLYCHGQAGKINDTSFSVLGGTNQSGGVPTWDDPNAVAAAAPLYAQTKDTGDCGTCHDTTADNQAQGGTFWPIWDTTDSQNDWSDSTQPVIWDVTQFTSLGSTTTELAHETHLDKLRGPKESCNQCHKTPPTIIGSESPGAPSAHVNNRIDFLDDATTLAGTNACDFCHAPNGVYDGVNSTSMSVGAKDNWETGVYQTDGRLVPAKERWCVGCHDTPGSNVKDVTATPVNGDNVNYGFYATGHGQKNMVKCTDCHDLELEHIDGEYRTYEFTDSGQSPQAFREGYRLMMIDGGYPLTVPMRSTGAIDQEFRMCFRCHNENTIFSDTQTVSVDPGTNFRRDGSLSFYSGASDKEPNNHKNLHYEMIYPGKTPSTSLLWDSDWDDTTDDNGTDSGFDSYPQCVTCHNPHGSEYPAMIRDGKEVYKTKALGGAFDGLEFSYVTTETTTAPGTWGRSTDVKVDSEGGVMRFLGNKAKKGVCSTDVCHGDGSNLAKIAPAPVYRIDAPWNDQPPPPPGGTLGQPQLIDYYRPVVPVITSALFTSDNTVSVVFTEPVTASLADFQNMMGSVALNPTAISGSGSEIIEIKISTTNDTTGTMDLNLAPFNSIVAVFNGRSLSPVFDQKIWDGRD